MHVCNDQNGNNLDNLWFHLLVLGVVQPAETHTHNQTRAQTQRSRTSEPRLSVCPRSCSDRHFWETERCESAGCWTGVCQCPYWLEIEDPLQMTETNINFWQYQRNRDVHRQWSKLEFTNRKKYPILVRFTQIFITCKKWTVKRDFYLHVQLFARVINNKPTSVSC